MKISLRRAHHSASKDFPCHGKIKKKNKDRARRLLRAKIKAGKLDGEPRN